MFGFGFGALIFHNKGEEMPINVGTNGVHKEATVVSTAADNKIFKLLARVNEASKPHADCKSNCKGVHCTMHSECFPLFKKPFCLTSWIYIIEGFEHAHMCSYCYSHLDKFADIGKVTTCQLFVNPNLS